MQQGNQHKLPFYPSISFQVLVLRSMLFSSAPAPRERSQVASLSGFHILKQQHKMWGSRSWHLWGPPTPSDFKDSVLEAAWWVLWMGPASAGCKRYRPSGRGGSCWLGPMWVSYAHIRGLRF